MRLSMDVSMGFVLRDLRKEARLGVKANAVDGMVIRVVELVREAMW